MRRGGWSQDPEKQQQQQHNNVYRMPWGGEQGREAWERTTRGRRKCLITCQIHMCSRASAFSEKLVIHWSSPTSLYPSPPLPTFTQPSFQLSFKQALVTPIKTHISGLYILLPLIFHFSTTSKWRFLKPWSLWLSPLFHFSLTLSPLQAEHPLQMLWQSH